MGQALGFQCRVIFHNPLFKDCNEFFRPRHDLGCFRLGSDKSVVIVNYVPLAPASVEIIAVRSCGFANSELRNFKGNPVVPSTCDT